MVLSLPLSYLRHLARRTNLTTLPIPRPAATLEPSTPPRDTVVADHGHPKLKQKNVYDKHTSAPLSALPPGNYVYAKPPLTTSKAWIPRKMVGHAGPRSYLIDTGKS